MFIVEYRLGNHRPRKESIKEDPISFLKQQKDFVGIFNQGDFWDSLSNLLKLENFTYIQYGGDGYPYRLFILKVKNDAAMDY